MTSLQNFVNRYYTIANCMNSYFEQDYANLTRAITEGTTYDPRYTSVKEAENLQDNNIELIIKYYHQSKDGISNQLYTMGNDGMYFINGPVGKGLNITPECQGRHVFFCGGTGILPFMDFFAYVLRWQASVQELGHSMFKDETYDALNSGFSMAVHAYFRSPDEALGINILQALQVLSDRSGNKKFSVSVTYTQS